MWQGVKLFHYDGSEGNDCFYFSLNYLWMILEFIAATSNMLGFSVGNCILSLTSIFAADACVVATLQRSGG